MLNREMIDALCSLATCYEGSCEYCEYSGVDNCQSCVINKVYRAFVKEED